ncbi:MAG TPA: FkbM family methyltransferase [Candidatus Sulfotelmatobacter sp.]|nr:FkbM family methyltransferase [Candidatus Sulfotelmatobacter sp.]
MMERNAGYRMMTTDVDMTGGTIARPLAILRQLVGRPDCVIFDVGANTGQSIERFLETFEQPTIHSFEPQPSAFSALYRRFVGDKRIHMNHVALSDRTGVAPLHCSSFGETASLIEMSPDSWWTKTLKLTIEGSMTVALDTIDRYCAERGITTIDLLKLDVQGAEPECLRGAQAMLGAVRVVQAEIILTDMYQRRGSFSAIEALLAPHGFRLFTMFDVFIAQDGEFLQLDAVYIR